MPKKIQNTTKENLLAVDLPQHGASYTVISHEFIIDYAQQALANAGFTILEEEYRCTADGQIAQGVYKLNYNNDPELAMMFAWTNSYNKQVKFKCVIGAYVNKTGSVMISGDIGSWVRKHTGSAVTETLDTVDTYIKHAYMYYNQLCSDKAHMESILLNKRKQSQLLGVLFAEYEILTTEQASMVRDQMKKPYHVFTNTDSLWAFYNYVTIALQNSHPKTWMEDQRILHYFISSINNFPKAEVPDPVVTEEESVDPLLTNYGQPENQTNLLVQIAEETGDDSLLNAQYPLTPEDVIKGIEPPRLPVEPANYDFSQTVNYIKKTNPDLHHGLEHLADAEEVFDHSSDLVVQYEDPAGNTFEVPVVPPCIGHDAETEKEIEKETIEDTQDEFALADNFDLDFSEETDEETDNFPDFF
jgi:hypothetical protein